MLVINNIKFLENGFKLMKMIFIEKELNNF